MSVLTNEDVWTPGAVICIRSNRKEKHELDRKEDPIEVEQVRVD